MKLSRRNWPALRLPLIILGVSALIAGSMAWYSGEREAIQLRALELQKDELNQSRQRSLAAEAERAAIVKYLPLYHQLIQQGFVGEERRIEWIDGLRDINRQHRLFGVNYKIGSREVFKPPIHINYSPFILHRSVMKMEMALLHEIDLLTMLNALRASRQTPFMVRDCEIRRLAGDEKGRLTPHLAASCDIDWLTIAEPRQAEVHP